MSRLIHYSSEPLTAVESRKHDPYKGGFAKTPGLWFSVEGEYDWVSWCKGERFHLSEFVCATQIILAPDHCVLTLEGPDELDAFASEFGIYAEWSTLYAGVNWDAVRARYQGLIIAPFCWERRLSDHTFWYYGWDCASGVIWDADAIAELRAVAPPDMTVEED